MSALLRAFPEEVATAGASARATYDTADLAGELKALYARGRQAHPKLRVDEEAFGRCVARCLDGGELPSFEKLAAEDLYLACACGAQARGAVAALEAGYAKVIRRAVSRVIASTQDRDDAEQRVWQHLLVGVPAAGPALAKYRAQVPLAKWIPVVAIRVALSLNRTESSERRLREKAGAEAIGASPEDMYMRAELRRAVGRRHRALLLRCAVLRSARGCLAEHRPDAFGIPGRRTCRWRAGSGEPQSCRRMNGSFD